MSNTIVNNDLRNAVFRRHCSDNNLDRVKDLIERDTESKLNLKRGFLMACIKGSLSVVKYLLETRKIKEKIDLYSPYEDNKGICTADRALINAYSNCQSNIVDYLLFEAKINISVDTINSLKANNTIDLLNKIEKRDLLIELGEKMPASEDIKNITKTKI
jgi:hypothetical protein